MWRCGSTRTAAAPIRFRPPPTACPISRCRIWGTRRTAISQQVIYERISFSDGWFQFRLLPDGTTPVSYYCRGGEASEKTWISIQESAFPPTYAQQDINVLQAQIRKLATAIAEYKLDATQIYRQGVTFIEGTAPP
jgi:hypothetical protein